MFIYNKMSDARIVLQATGEQDEYLTKNANSTFFKKKFETYSDYGSNWIQLSNNDKIFKKDDVVVLIFTPFNSKLQEIPKHKLTGTEN